MLRGSSGDETGLHKVTLQERKHLYGKKLYGFSLLESVDFFFLQVLHVTLPAYFPYMSFGSQLQGLRFPFQKTKHEDADQC